MPTPYVKRIEGQLMANRIAVRTAVQQRYAGRVIDTISATSSVRASEPCFDAKGMHGFVTPVLVSETFEGSTYVILRLEPSSDTMKKELEIDGEEIVIRHPDALRALIAALQAIASHRAAAPILAAAGAVAGEDGR